MRDGNPNVFFTSYNSNLQHVLLRYIRTKLPHRLYNSYITLLLFMQTSMMGDVVQHLWRAPGWRLLLKCLAFFSHVTS